MSLQHEPFCFDSGAGQFFWYDHFLGDQIQDEFNAGGGSGYSTTVVDGVSGGIVRLTTGTSDGYVVWISWGSFETLLVSKNVCFESRFSINSLSVSRVFFGILNTWNDYITISYDSTATTRWRTGMMSGGVGGYTNIGNPDADTSYHNFRTQAHTHGGNHAHYYVDGSELATSPISTNVPTTYLQIYLERDLISGGVAKSMDIDYMAVRQDR